MKKINVIGRFLSMMAIAMVTLFSLSSCSTDDYEITEVTYSMGFNSFSSSSSSFLTEMEAVESAFQTALGITSSTFTLDGTVTLCDIEVKAACAVAKTAISALSIDSSFEYVVTNVTTGDVVYTLTN